MTLREALRLLETSCSALPLQDLQSRYDSVGEIGEWRSDDWGNRWFKRRHRSSTRGLLDLLGIEFDGRMTKFRDHLHGLGVKMTGVDARFVKPEERHRRSKASKAMHEARSSKKRQEMAKKIGDAQRGGVRGPMPVEVRQKMSRTRKGRKHSVEWSANISRALRGRKLSPAHLETIRRRKKNTYVNGFPKGSSHSKATREKMSAAAIKRIQDGPLPPQFQTRKTDIELLFEQAADMRMFRYVGYFPKDGSNDRNRKYVINSITPDFVCPSRKIAVWLDGCYWHGCGECFPGETKFAYKREVDAAMNEKARSMGWQVLRLKSHQILGRPPSYLRRVYIDPLF